MEPQPLTFIYYRTNTGKYPFNEWLDDLPQAHSARIIQRLRRIERTGLEGNYRELADGLMEYKFHNPALRVYAAKVAPSQRVLLCGGDKSGQSRDIAKARKYLADFFSQTE